MFGGFGNTGFAQGKNLEDIKHPPLKDFLIELVDDEVVAEKCYTTLTQSYVNNVKQLLDLGVHDLSELQFPLGVRKKMVEGINKYLEEQTKSENSLEDNHHFTAEKSKTDGRIKLKIKNMSMRQTLQNMLNVDEMFKPEPVVPIEHFLRVLPQLQMNQGYKEEDEELMAFIKEKYKHQNNINVFGGFGGYGGAMAASGEFNQQNPVHHLLKYLYSVVKEEFQKLEDMVEKGFINYESLWYVFQPQSKAITLDKARRKSLEGYRVNSYQYSRGYYRYFLVNLSHIASNGKLFSYLNKQAYIHHFEGVKSMSELEIMPLKVDSDQYKELEKRGEQYAKLAVGHHYLEYKGYMSRQRFWTSVDEKADGKVMVDISANQKMQQSGSGLFGSQASNFGGMSLGQAMNGDGSANSFEVLPKELYWMTPSSIPGFSFVNKRWGQLDLYNLSPIVFQKEAFDLLVLNQHKKDVIKALVTHSDKAFSDFIEHKGKGCIFLLHGPPGVGKTLTAEAIAEYLERPLYAVSVGELGTKPATLEKNLSDILELAGIWNAVVLVDEADIFLERRSESDIIRNAMVGVFLRVVEYFNGVLFLTSNRVRCLDRAFHSRVSVALKYPDLDQKSRLKIWHHFLDKCGMELEDSINLNTLSSYDLNGRQIRSTIRLACSLAHNEFENKKTKELKLRMAHITDCVSISNQFEDFVANPNLMQQDDDNEDEVEA